MATPFNMPKLGLTMEAGKILEWLVDDGATVAEGDAVLVIETDKVESEVESSGSGVLHRIGDVGETYDCGVQIGWFLEPGEAVPAAAAPAAAPAASATTAAPSAAAPAAVAPAPVARTSTGRIMASPNAKRVAAELGVDIATVVGSGPGGRIVSEDVEAAAADPSRRVAPAPAVLAPVSRPTGTGRALASFAARHLADELGLDLDTVGSLTGDVRISREDVVAHARNLIAHAVGASAGTPLAAPTAPPAPAAAPLLQTPSSSIALSGMRGTIAERMHASLQQMAQLTLFMDVDMSAVVADRERRKAGGAAPGFTDYVIAAAARALVDHPFVNSQVTDDAVAVLPQVNIGMAVALDEGLVVPVIRNTPDLSIEDLSAETTRLAEAARGGKLSLNDLEGGTFSVTALGMYGVDGFTPVINAPNTAILGVGRLRDETRWVDDTPQRTTVLTLSLTWDHRAFDGAPAAEFTRTIRTYLEAVGQG